MVAPRISHHTLLPVVCGKKIISPTSVCRIFFTASYNTHTQTHKANRSNFPLRRSWEVVSSAGLEEILLIYSLRHRTPPGVDRASLPPSIGSIPVSSSVFLCARKGKQEVDRFSFLFISFSLAQHLASVFPQWRPLTAQRERDQQHCVPSSLRSGVFPRKFREAYRPRPAKAFPLCTLLEGSETSEGNGRKPQTTSLMDSLPCHPHCGRNESNGPRSNPGENCIFFPHAVGFGGKSLSFGHQHPTHT